MLETAPNYSQRFTRFRSGQIRRHTAFQLDASLLKTTRLGERMRFQFGFEAFNLLNHNYFGRDQVNRNPEDSRWIGRLTLTSLGTTLLLLLRQASKVARHAIQSACRCDEGTPGEFGYT